MIQRHAMLIAQDFLSSSAFPKTAQIFSQTGTRASKVLFMKHELWSKMDFHHRNKGAWTQLAACEFARGFSFAFIWIYAYFEAEPSAFHLFITSRGALAAVLLRWEIMSPLDFSFMMPSWAEEQLMSPESYSRGGGEATGKTHFGSGGRTLESSSGSDIPPLCPVSMLEGSSINASFHHFSSQGLLQLRVPLSGSVNPYRGLVP